MTREPAEDAVRVTEHDAVPGPEAASAQLDPGLLKASVETDEEKLTVPVGVVVTPEEVLTTVAVTVTGCPTAAVPLESATDAEVERLLTVKVAAAEAAL